MGSEEWSGYTDEDGHPGVSHVLDGMRRAYSPLATGPGRREAQAMVCFAGLCCYMLELWARALGLAVRMDEMRRFVAEARERSRREAP